MPVVSGPGPPRSCACRMFSGHRICGPQGLCATGSGAFAHQPRHAGNQPLGGEYELAHPIRASCARPAASAASDLFNRDGRYLWALRASMQVAGNPRTISPRATRSTADRCHVRADQVRVTGLSLSLQFRLDQRVPRHAPPSSPLQQPCRSKPL